MAFCTCGSSAQGTLLRPPMTREPGHRTVAAAHLSSLDTRIETLRAQPQGKRQVILRMPAPAGGSQACSSAPRCESRRGHPPRVKGQRDFFFVYAPHLVRPVTLRWAPENPFWPLDRPVPHAAARLAHPHETDFAELRASKRAFAWLLAEVAWDR